MSWASEMTPERRAESDARARAAVEAMRPSEKRCHKRKCGGVGSYYRGNEMPNMRCEKCGAKWFITDLGVDWANLRVYMREPH